MEQNFLNDMEENEPILTTVDSIIKQIQQDFIPSLNKPNAMQYLI